MPLKKCSQDGKSGWQWGDSGKCYVGKDAKRKAIKQGIAVEGPEKFKEIVGEVDKEDESVIAQEIFQKKLDRLSSVGKIVGNGDEWKILGQGKVYPTYEDALEAWIDQ